MKAAITFALAAVFLGFAIHWTQSITAIPSESFTLASRTPIDEISDCVEAEGWKAKADIEKISECRAGAGGGRTPCQNGATYASQDEQIRLTIQSRLGLSELTVRSYAPLTDKQIKIFRSCAKLNGSNPPHSSHSTTQSRRDRLNVR